MKVMYAIVVFCLLLTACGTNKTVNAGEHHAYKPTLDVKVDVSGNQATVTVDTDLHISHEHYDQARVEGEGHIHMYLDDGEKIPVTEGKHVIKDLQPGTHTLKVSLHNNDHTPYDVTKTVEFTVK